MQAEFYCGWLPVPRDLSMRNLSIENENPAGTHPAGRSCLAGSALTLLRYFGDDGLVSCMAVLLGMVPGTLGMVLMSPVTASSILML